MQMGSMCSEVILKSPSPKTCWQCAWISAISSASRSILPSTERICTFSCLRWEQCHGWLYTIYSSPGKMLFAAISALRSLASRISFRRLLPCCRKVLRACMKVSKPVRYPEGQPRNLSDARQDRKHSDRACLPRSRVVELSSCPETSATSTPDRF